MKHQLLSIGLCSVLAVASCKDSDEDERPGARGLAASPMTAGQSSNAAQPPKIDAQQAIAAATAAVPGSAQEVRLESRAGKPEYEVSVLPKGASSRVRVEVDATSGQVTRSGGASAKDDDEDEDERR